MSQSPLRILHISTRLILGGSQENTLLSCEGQARLGHEVHLAFGPIYGPEGSLLERVRQFNAAVATGQETGASHGNQMAEPRSIKGITTHEIPDLVREVSPLQDWRAYKQLRALIRELKPDIVHTHSSKAGVLGRFAAWDEFARDVQAMPVPGQDEHCWQCRVVHTIHGPPFMPIDPREPPITRLKRRVNNAVYTLAERAAAKRCHTIVSVADAMTREFLRRGIGRPEQYVTVYSGMETERFLSADGVARVGAVADGSSAGDTAAGPQDRASIRAALGLRDDDFVVGTVARLAEHKGHDDVLDALHEMLARDERVKLLWVGDGWWRDRLLDRARVLGVRVHRGAGVERGEATTAGSNAALNRALVRKDEGSQRTMSPSRSASGSAHDLPFGEASDPRSHERGLCSQDSSGDSTDAAAPITGQIITTGLVPPERVPGLIRAMDVLVHPSYREGLPRTVPQAQLCGVVPIAYDCDGTSEAIVSAGVSGGSAGPINLADDRASTGILVPTGDIAALRRAVEWARAHPAKCRAMGERGRAAAAARFDAKVMVEALERVYQR